MESVLNDASLLSLVTSTIEGSMDGVIDVLHHGVKGSLGGGIVGFCIGAASCIINSFLFTKVTPLWYSHKGEKRLFRGFEIVADTKMEEDIRTLAIYRDCRPDAFDAACHLMQNVVDVYTAFKAARAKGKDGVRYIAKMHRSALRVDTLWRGLHYAVKDAKDQYGGEETLKAAMNIHFAIEGLLAEMREDFQLNEQIELPVSQASTEDLNRR